MGKHDGKLTRAAHIKNHTVGTSNEISFSVLDAAKNALDGGESPSRAHGFGSISLFTLSGKKKTISTPKKEKGLHLPGGGFVSTEDSSGSSGEPFLKMKGQSTASSRPSSSSVSSDTAISAPTRSESKGFGSWVAPANEVAAKKRARKTRKFFATAAAFCVVVALIGAAGYWLYNNHLIYQDNIGQLNKAVALVQEADGTMLVLDELMRPLIDEGGSLFLTSEQHSSLNDVRQALPDAQVHLRNALLFAGNALSGLSDSVDKEAAEQLISSIEARQRMVDPSLSLMDEAAKATEAYAIAQDAWTALLDADTSARTAAGYLTDPSIENLQASISKTKEGVGKLREAASLFTSAQSAYPEADFSVYQEYIAKRLEALNYAIASDQALIERNLEEAVSQNDLYAASDAEAAKIAERIPRTPSYPIEVASSLNVDEAKQSYIDARLEASTSDSFLRDYLGSES